jgi:hypothetical protein
LSQKIGLFIVWLNDLQEMNPNNIVVFKETTPSHFNSIDGSYERWDGTYNAHGPYLCSPLKSISYETKASQTPENDVAEKIFKAWKETRVQYLQTWEALAPFWKIHGGNCEKQEDCLHHCAYVPTAFAPIWRQLNAIVQAFDMNDGTSRPKDSPSTKTDDFLRTNSPENAFINMTNMILFRDQYIRSEGSFPIRYCEEGGDAGSASPCVYYLVEHGMKRRVADGFAGLHLLFQRAVDESEVVDISSQEDLSLYPEAFEVKPLLQDGTLIEEETRKTFTGWAREGQLYCIVDGTRYAFSGAGFAMYIIEKMKIPEWEVRGVPKYVLDLIPVGVGNCPLVAL